MKLPELDAGIEGELLRNGSQHRTVREPTTLRKPCGIRGPRSKIVEAILLLLYSRPMKSSEIAAKLGKPSRYVSSYLSYWRSRGLVDYRAGYWFLTHEGEEYVKMLVSAMRLRQEELLSHSYTNELVDQTMNSKDQLKIARESGALQPFIVEQTSSSEGEEAHSRVSKALKCLEKVLGDKNLDEEEYAVLQHLVKHYAEWGSTYQYLDQIAENLRYEPRQLLVVLRKLQTKKLIYMYTDKRFGLRVGLGKSLKQLIDKCVHNAH